MPTDRTSSVDAIRNDTKTLVPEVGLEPTRPCGHWILNPARLPIPPLRRKHKKMVALFPMLGGAAMRLFSHAAAEFYQ